MHYVTHVNGKTLSWWCIHDFEFEVNCKFQVILDLAPRKMYVKVKKYHCSRWAFNASVLGDLRALPAGLRGRTSRGPRNLGQPRSPMQRQGGFWLRQFRIGRPVRRGPHGKLPLRGSAAGAQKRLLLLFEACRTVKCQRFVNYSGNVCFQTSRVIDAYHNQTLLVLSFLEWGAAHCQGAKFIGKADEDTWINIRGVLKYLRLPEAGEVSGRRTWDLLVRLLYKASWN